MSDFTQVMQELPPSGLVIFALVIVTGIMLWGGGRKILRAGFAIGGLIIGGLAGWVTGQTVNIGASPWVIAAVGAIIMACVGAIAFRLAVAASMALILALLSPLSVLTFAELQAKHSGHKLNEGEVHNPVADGFTDWLRTHDDPQARQQVGDAISATTQSVSGAIDRAKNAPNISEQTKAHIDQAQQFGHRVIESTRNEWSRTPPTLRPTLILSSVCGGLLGIFLGILAPRFSAAAVTALGGSLLWLSGVRVIATHMGVPADAPWLPSSGIAWLSLWLITSVAGLAIQWIFKRPPADKPSKNSES